MHTRSIRYTALYDASLSSDFVALDAAKGAPLWRTPQGRAARDNRKEGNINGESNEEAVDERGRAYLEDAGTGENENERGCS
jgi:hypothetical protein